MKLGILVLLLIPFGVRLNAITLIVGADAQYKTIKSALLACNDNDTIVVSEGIYKEGNLIISKKIVFIGQPGAILDGESQYEILSIKSSNVVVKGFKLQNSGFSTLNDPGAIKVYDAHNVVVENNILENNFFGIYIQYGQNCVIKNNQIHSTGTEEQKIGNGIHCWKSDSLLIIGNEVGGHRDGIYFEFVTNSLVWRNKSKRNVRYGLHFMFSNSDSYIANQFIANGAGVAVMFSKEVRMYNNYFKENWGEAAYGILLKEISDSEILANTFEQNTAALYLEGASRMIIEKNSFVKNGWALKMQASCIDNKVSLNNFFSNTFDVSTNGTVVLNSFNQNYWDKYEGYDLNKDGVGDIPFHPLSLFCVLSERNPTMMFIFRSFIVDLLDKSEKLLPSITPMNFVDEKPMMKSYSL